MLTVKEVLKGTFMAFPRISHIFLIDASLNSGTCNNVKNKGSPNTPGEAAMAAASRWGMTGHVAAHMCSSPFTAMGVAETAEAISPLTHRLDAAAKMEIHLKCWIIHFKAVLNWLYGISISSCFQIHPLKMFYWTDISKLLFS